MSLLSKCIASLWVAIGLVLLLSGCQLDAFQGASQDIDARDPETLETLNPKGALVVFWHALTGAELYGFAYDDDGLLVSIEDGDGNITTVERDGNGDPLAIVSPYGQRTTFTLDANGYLESITSPANEVSQFTYTDDGLMTDMVDDNPQMKACMGEMMFEMCPEMAGKVMPEENRAAFVKRMEEALRTGQQESTGV